MSMNAGEYDGMPGGIVEFALEANQRGIVRHKSLNWIEALLGGAVTALLVLASVDALLALAGGGEILLSKLGWIEQLSFFEQLRDRRLDEAYAQGLRVWMSLALLAGGAAGAIAHAAGFMRPGWFFSSLASLKAGVVLLIVSAAAAIGGTIYEMDDALSLVFDTWWFRVLLLALALNIGVATYVNLRRKVLPNLRPRAICQPAYYAAEGGLSFEIPFRGAADELPDLLRRHGFWTAREGAFICGRKGVLQRFGSVVSHIGFIAVLISSLLVGFVSREGRITLAEGETADEYELLPGAREQQRQEMQFGEARSDVLPLGFQLRCLDFELGFHPRTPMPSKFISLVEIVDGDRRFIDSIEVNNSLKYKGLTFHQSRYWEIEGDSRLRLLARDKDADYEREADVDMGQPAPIAGLGTALLDHDELGIFVELSAVGQTKARQYLSHGARIHALQYFPDFGMKEGRFFSRSEEPNNPALQIELEDPGKEPRTIWLFQRENLRAFSHGSFRDDLYTIVFVGIESDAQNEPRFALEAHGWRSGELLNQFTLGLDETRPLWGDDSAVAAREMGLERYEFELQGRVPRYCTVLSISRNPLLPWIYVCCGVMVAGLLMAFFIQLRDVQLWVDGETGVIRAAVTYRNGRQDLTRDAQALLKELRQLSDGAKDQ
ncbi:cytochrome c biogenesis protein ResB [Candidatus Sumerlaeota bacterium]|nr:cytochrome c biogenesis protein ResB [Candidatus Sumerlaeota bacterium]